MEADTSTSQEIAPGTILSQEEGFFTFKVDDVKVNKKKITLKTAEEIVRKNLGLDAQFEDFSHRENQDPSFVSGKIPGFLLALHTCYDLHYPLKLSVSDFIILIGQGLGRHIDVNSEKLRKFFVDHEGKEEIEIFRDGFVKGKQNDWSTVFEEFGTKIKERVKSSIYDVVVDDTSVATKDSRIVSEITLMDCMKHYFQYKVTTRCGIPQITLVGPPDDWKKLNEKLRKLIEMNRGDCLQLDWWLKHLTPIVEKVCQAGITRKVDATFWSGIYKWKSPGSGSPYISGWCTVFFPYLTENKMNTFDRPDQPSISTSEIPKQICEVPFVWQYLGNPIKMTFYGGFIGAHFNNDNNEVSPAYFWCVAYGGSSKEGQEQKKQKKNL